MSVQEFFGIFASIQGALSEQFFTANMRPLYTAVYSSPEALACLQSFVGAINDRLGQLYGEISNLTAQLGFLSNELTGLRSSSSRIRDPDPFIGDTKEVKKRQTEFRSWRAGCELKLRLDKNRVSVQPYVETIMDNENNPAVWHWQNLTDLFLHFQQAYDTTDKAGQGLLENIADMQFRVGRSCPAPFDMGFKAQARVDQAPAPARGDPMDLDAFSLNRISQSERDRRLALGFCLYCGEEGHTKNNCPEGQQKTQQQGRRYTDRRGQPQTPFTPFRRLTPGPTPRTARLRAFGWEDEESEEPPAADETQDEVDYEGPAENDNDDQGNDTITKNGKSVKVPALVDTGCTALAFVDIDFVNDNAFETLPLPKPKNLLLADGKSTDPVTHFMVATLRVGPHVETLPLLVTRLGAKNPVILGLPWLKIHNPHVNWATGVFTFASSYCYRTCFDLTPATTVGAQPYSYGTVDSEEQVSEAAIKSKLPPEYHDLIKVFYASEAAKLPPYRSYDHKIELEPGKDPPNARNRPFSRQELRVIKKYLDENLDKGFVRPSKSRAAAPLLLAKKPGGGVRVCVDYRGLNNITIKNRYPLPLIRETLDSLCHAKYFTKLDVIAAFNRVRVAEEDVWKTAFITRFGLYETLVTPFGLCNAPSTFQNFINDVLYEGLDKYTSAYLDDVLIYSKTKKEHVHHVRKVLSALLEAGLHVDIKKCEFHTTETKYLGLIIGTDGIKMDPKKVEAITNWEQPQHVKDVQKFLGFANFYRRFIKSFSSILKAAFTSALTLAFFDPLRRTIVETDASDWASGGHFMTTKLLNQRQARWAEFLSQFNFRIVYRPGTHAVKPDALSRKPGDAPSSKTDTADERIARRAQIVLPASRLSPGMAPDDAPLQLYALDTSHPIEHYIDIAYNADRDTQDMISALLHGTKWPATIRKKLRVPFAECTTRQGRVYWQDKLFIPWNDELKLQLMYRSYHLPVGGHPGEAKTIDLIKRSYWWPDLYRDVETYVQACAQCRRMKRPRSRPQGYLKPLPVPYQPWSEISIDHIVKLPVCERDGVKYRNILVVVDRLTKMRHFVPCEEVDVEGVVDAFLKHIFPLHGVPLKVLSDRGGAFIATFWGVLSKRLGCTLTYTSGYHPETNGQTERLNSTIAQFLRCFVNARQDDWVDWLPLAEFTANNHVSSTTGMSPFFANYGYNPRMGVEPAEPNLPASLVNRNDPGHTQTRKEYDAANVFVENLGKIIKGLRYTLEKAQDRYRNTANRICEDAPAYVVGDEVYLSTEFLPQFHADISPKLNNKWIGDTEYLVKWKDKKPVWQPSLDFGHRCDLIRQYEANGPYIPPAEDTEIPPPLPMPIVTYRRKRTTNPKPVRNPIPESPENPPLDIPEDPAPEPLEDLAPEPLEDLAPEPLEDLAPEPPEDLAPEDLAPESPPEHPEDNTPEPPKNLNRRPPRDFNARKQWTPDEDRILHSYREAGHSWEDTAKKLGRTKASCQGRLKTLSSEPEVKHRWTEEEDKVLRESREAGETWTRTAARLKLPTGVWTEEKRTKLVEMLRYNSRNARGDPRDRKAWSEENVAKLYRMRRDGRSWEDISAATGYEIGACKSRWGQRGWSEEDSEILRNGIRRGVPFSRLCSQLERNHSPVLQHARKLGLKPKMGEA
ncbi:hypothetical protein FHL15_005106 [Xylaria flabelliformis]|uniref:Reverse transcriptase n=1 Tax=Xylaria flabelliformis TaxID=2512241 RepID=A0A553I1E6_9PEZI|nr:hypothetical protein FHL15_005106 [Xylaria flabelliformis]